MQKVRKAKREYQGILMKNANHRPSRFIHLKLNKFNTIRDLLLPVKHVHKTHCLVTNFFYNNFFIKRCTHKWMKRWMDEWDRLRERNIKKPTIFWLTKSVIVTEKKMLLSMYVRRCKRFTFFFLSYSICPFVFALKRLNLCKNTKITMTKDENCTLFFTLSIVCFEKCIYY